MLCITIAFAQVCRSIATDSHTKPAPRERIMRIATMSVFLLAGCTAIWSASASAQNANDPKKKLDPVINNNAVRVNPNPGPVNRITPAGVRPMTPNATSQTGRLQSRSVPSPTSPNARKNTQGRNVNPTGDPNIAQGFDKNQKSYAARTQRPVTRPAAPAVTRPAWPGPSRPAATARPTTTPASSATSSTTSTSTKK